MLSYLAGTLNVINTTMLSLKSTLTELLIPSTQGVISWTIRTSTYFVTVLLGAIAFVVYELIRRPVVEGNLDLEAG